MTTSDASLPSDILELCQACPPDEGRAVVAYCCYMAFADRSLRRMEVDSVRAVAAQFGITPDETAKMARRVRHRRLKIKKPESDAGRQLLFQLALHLAAVDEVIDDREQKAIDQLASQLGIESSTVQQALEDLANSRDARPPEELPAREEAPESRKGFFARLFECVTPNLVVTDLEADLFRHLKFTPSGRKGEVEYTITKAGEVELEIELNDRELLPPDSTVTLFVAEQPVCEVAVPDGILDQTIRSRNDSNIPQIAPGDSAEIRLGGKTILRGEFRAK